MFGVNNSYPYPSGLRNGVVRIQCIATGADGKEQVTGELMIPAARYGPAAGKQLQEKTGAGQKSSGGAARALS